MSLSPLQSKRRRTEITTGTHLAVIADMFLLRNDKKDLIKKDDCLSIVVIFKDGKNNVHEQHYLLDNGIRQGYFMNMIKMAQVPMEEGKQPKKSDAIGKRLWLSIQEIHHVNDDQIIHEEGVPVIEYRLFKVHPHMDGGKKPIVKGDPEENNGIAGDEFISYNNQSGEMSSILNEQIKKEVKITEDQLNGVFENKRNVGQLPIYNEPNFDTPVFDAPVATQPTPSFGNNISTDESFYNTVPTFD